MTLSTVLTLLKSVATLLTLVQLTPHIPTDIRQSALSVAESAVKQIAILLDAHEISGITGTTTPSTGTPPPVVIQGSGGPSNPPVNPIPNPPVQNPTPTPVSTGIQNSAFDIFSSVEGHALPNSQASISEAYNPSGSSWRADANEQAVFQALMANNSSNTTQAFQLRIGKGGQIYSLRTSAGEVIPPQGHFDSTWVDSVYQTVAVNTKKLVFQPRDINLPSSNYALQAGVYQRDPTFSGVFYSPTLASQALTGEYRTLNWSQQAHIPTVLTSSMLTYTEYRDLGNGIIEVNTILYNFGTSTDDTIDRFNMPWSVIRTSSYPSHYVANADGSLTARTGAFADTDIIAIKDTAGWSLFTQNNPATTSSSLAFVFGKAAPNAVYHYGVGGSPTLDQFVSTAIVNTALSPGRALAYRYYLVVGTYAGVTARAATLASTTLFRAVSYDPAQTPVLSWDLMSDGAHPHTGNASPSFCTYTYPVNDTVPVFVLRNTHTQQIVVSTNPYTLSVNTTYQGASVYHPYDGNTQYLGILGFIPSNGSSIQGCSTTIQ